MSVCCVKSGRYLSIFLTFAAEEYGEKNLSVKVDGEEVELSFIDHPSNEISVSDLIFVTLRLI